MCVGNCSSTLQANTVVTTFLVTIEGDRKLADTLLNETVVTDDAGCTLSWRLLQT